MPTQQQVRSRRGRNAQAASAQQLKTENVTAEQSVTLMKNLFRTSISTICYLRDLFPEDCFKEKRLTDITIQTLDPKCDNAEATLLIEWLEKGVFDALDRKFLDGVFFGIFEQVSESDEDNAENTKLLESYNFKVNYPEDNQAPSGFSIEHNDEIPKVIQSRQEVKSATVRMIRTLITYTETLGSIPKDRWLTMKLLYRDEYTPPSYEPVFFGDGKNQAGVTIDPFEFDSTPIVTKMGNVSTQHHELSLKVKTLDDCFNESITQPDSEISKLGDATSDEEAQVSDLARKFEFVEATKKQASKPTSSKKTKTRLRKRGLEVSENSQPSNVRKLSLIKHPIQQGSSKKQRI